jgi:hypothetical protein
MLGRVLNPAPYTREAWNTGLEYPRVPFSTPFSTNNQGYDLQRVRRARIGPMRISVHGYKALRTGQVHGSTKLDRYSHQLYYQHG